MTEFSMAAMRQGVEALRRLELARIRAELAPKLWINFVAHLRTGTVRVTEEPGGEPLVEGVDFWVDLERGVVSFGPGPFEGMPLDVRRSEEVVVSVRAEAPSHYARAGRRVAQWKTERQGRRA